MEVKTGRVRAIANLSRNEDGDYEEDYNYAIGEATEPGSTFKLATMIALLEDGHVRPESTVDVGNGVTEYYGQKVIDSQHEALGVITVQRAFEVSSNVGITKLAYDNYKEKPELFVNRLYEMGLNQKLGVEIKGEGQPDIKYPDNELWSGISLPMDVHGLRDTYDPTPDSCLYTMRWPITGKMVKPVFVEEVRSHGKVVKRAETEVLE